MRKQEIICPYCGQVVEIPIPNFSKIVEIFARGEGSIELEEYEEPTQEIIIPKNSHKRLFSEEYCDKVFRVYVKYGAAAITKNNLKPDWSVEI